MSDSIKLGKDARYPQSYDPNLLQAIPRSQSRDQVFAPAALPFSGCDLWNAYEVSWLNAKGRPEVAIAEFSFCASSDNIIESKSFKYYLNSLNSSVFASRDEVLAVLRRDLSKVSGADVTIRFFALEEFASIHRPTGFCVDALDVEIDQYEPAASLLVVGDEQVSKERMYSHLLKSNCPVTGQPDWATIWIEYSGKKIDPASFLRYVVSFRDHQGFHESCVEKVFADLQSRCLPTQLSVYARYTRRGGLDINPYRTSVGSAQALPFGRLARQ